MANEVDNRVVQLEMDNGSFEKGANQSIKTLDKLDKALEFKNGKRSFSEVEEAAAKCDFKTLLTAGDAVVAKFSAIGVAGITAIQNITNRAVDAGIKIAKSLSIDQVTTGFSKYEQKTANVQTLINSTGKSIDEVNEYLDRLMWFSDETSYGFTDMTQALSTMVSAGGDIDKLVPMIEGMANATAFAGKGAAEFNRVIYNLNQSYSQGFLTYMDWKSVQMAGASSKQLVDQLIRAGEEAGTIEKGEVTVDNFTSTLSKKWANREVMEKAFGYFDEMTQKAYEMIGTVDESGNVIDTASQAYEILSRQYDGVSINAAKAAQEAKSFTEAIDSTKDAVSSGWMRTFEIIIGNYEQAKTLWTDVADGLWNIFAGGFEERNNLLQEVFQTNPIENYAKSLEKAGIKYDDFKAKAKAAYRETTNASDRMSDKDFEAMTAGATSFNDLLKQSWVNSSILEKTLGNFGPNMSDASNGTKTLSGDIRSLLKDVNSGKYGHGIKEQQKNLIAAGFDGSALGDRWLNKMYNAVGNGNKEAIESINEMMFAVEESNDSLEDQVRLYDDLKSGAKDFDNSYYAQNSGRTIALDGLKNVLNAIGDRLGAIGKAWDKVFPKKTADQIKQYIVAFHQFTESLKMGAHQGQTIEIVATKAFTILSKIRDVIVGFGKVGVSLFKLGNRFIEWVSKLESVKSFIEEVKSFLNEITGGAINNLGSFADKLADISTYLDSIDESSFEKIQLFLDTISKTGKSVVLYLDSAAKKFKDFIANIFSGNGNDFSKVFSFGAIGAAIILALKHLKENIEYSGLFTIATLLKDTLTPIGDIIGSFMDKLDSDVLKNIAISIGILAVSLLVLSSIDSGKLVGALTAIAVVMIILYEAVKKLSSLNAGRGDDDVTGLGNLVKGLFNGLRGNLDMRAISNMVKSIAASLLLLSIAIKIMSSMDLSGAIIALASLFVVTKILENFMKSMEDLEPTSMKSLISIAISMLIFAKAMKSIGQLSFGSALQGLVSIGIILIFLKWFLSETESMNSSAMLAMAASMLVIGTALVVISAAIAILGLLDVSTIAKGVITIGVLLTIFGFFANKMNQIDPASILSASVAIFVMSSALMLIATALLIASIASGNSVVGLLTTFMGIVTIFALLNKFGGDSASMLSTAASLIIVSGAILVIAAALSLLSALKNPTDAVLTMFGSLVVVFGLLGIAAAVLAPITPAILSLALALLAIGAATLLAGVGLTILSVSMVSFAASIVANIGLIMSAISLIIDGIGVILLSLGGVIISVATQLIPDLVNAALIIVNALINGFASNIGGIVTGVSNLIVNLLNALSTGIPSIVQAGIEFALALINGFADGIRNNSSEIFSAFKNILSSLIELAIDAVGELLGLIPGVGPKIEQALGKAKDSVRNFLVPEKSNDAGDAMVSNIEQAGTAGASEAFTQGQLAGDSYNAGFASKTVDMKYGTLGGISLTPGMSGIPSNVPASYVSAPKPQSETKNTSMLDGLISGGDVNSFISNFTSQLGSADMSGAGSLLGGNLMDSLSTYIGGQGTTDFIAKFQDTFAEGDFSAVTDNITTVFGSDLTTSFGSVENTDAVKSAAEDLMENGVDSAKKVDAKPAGKSFCSGVVQGINDTASTVIEAARKLGEQAKQAFDDAFGNAANGLSEDGGYRTESEDDYGNEAFSEDPVTIRPVLDMSDIYSTLDEFDSVYTPTVRPTLDMAGADPGYSNVAAVAAYDSRNVNGYETETRTSVATVAPISFTQNNYSPKNLSRVDIYRQTRNQLDAYEEIRRKR